MTNEEFHIVAKSIGLSIVAAYETLYKRADAEALQKLRATRLTFRVTELGEQELLSIDGDGLLQAFCPPNRRFFLESGQAKRVKAVVLAQVEQWWREMDALEQQCDDEETDDDDEIDDEPLTPEEQAELLAEWAETFAPAPAPFAEHIATLVPGEPRDRWILWVETCMDWLAVGADLAECTQAIADAEPEMLERIQDTLRAAVSGQYAAPNSESVLNGQAAENGMGEPV